MRGERATELVQLSGGERPDRPVRIAGGIGEIAIAEIALRLGAGENLVDVAGPGINLTRSNIRPDEACQRNTDPRPRDNAQYSQLQLHSSDVCAPQVILRDRFL